MLFSAVLLFRLYDLPARVDHSAPTRARRARMTDLLDSSLDALIRERPQYRAVLVAALSGHSSSATILHADGEIYGICFFDVRSRGEVGPILAQRGDRDHLRDILLRDTLQIMKEDGYAYAIGQEDMPAPADLSSCTVIIRKDLPTRARDRDIALPTADVFLPLEDFTNCEDRRVELGATSIEVRRPRASEKRLIADYVAAAWGPGWGGEIDVATSSRPFSCIVAIVEGRPGPVEDWLMGFMCYDVTAPGLTGSTAIDRKVKGTSMELAAALFSRVLSELHATGFDYAILGGVSRRVPLLRASERAFTIPGSFPGVYSARGASMPG